MFRNRLITLTPKRRGFHLVTDEIVNQLPEIEQISEGLLTLLLQHTSASLSLNENADPTVRQDLETAFNNMVPESQMAFKHIDEGPDDMPAHVKSALLGVQLMIPISAGRLQLGMWQGIVLGEHRNHGGSRSISALLQSN